MQWLRGTYVPQNVNGESVRLEIAERLLLTINGDINSRNHPGSEPAPSSDPHYSYWTVDETERLSEFLKKHGSLRGGNMSNELKPLYETRGSLAVKWKAQTLKKNGLILEDTTETAKSTKTAKYKLSSTFL